MKVAGFIYSNLNTSTLSQLTIDRTVAAIPFACRYRLVDFALSNMVNAGITNINIFANYNYRSLSNHIGSGKDWDLARRSGGINIISPYQTAKTPSGHVFATHLEALLNVYESHIESMKEDYVVLADSDYIFNVDLTDALKKHVANNADVTIVTANVPSYLQSQSEKVVVQYSDDDKVTNLELKSTFEKDDVISANTLIISVPYLKNVLHLAKEYKYTSFTKNILLARFTTDHYYVYRHTGPFTIVSTVNDYFQACMSLVEDHEVYTNLIKNPSRPIYTKVHNSIPTIYRKDASVTNSIIADGCLIEGTVENSIIFRGVHVKKGAVVKNSILFLGTEVGENTTLNYVFTDKNVTIGNGLLLAGYYTIPFFIQKGMKI